MGAALVAALGLLAAGTARLATTAGASTVGASAVSLVDDDGGAALFSSTGLRPGSVQTACVGLTATGSVDPTTEVSLSADVRAGGLSPYLQVWVEQGSVPAGGSCGDFTGSVIWTGTLDRFPVAGTAGIATGWHPAVTARRVYRFTVTVLDDPRAQAQRTSATFRWAFAEAGASVVAPASPTAAPTAAAPATRAPDAPTSDPSTPPAGPVPTPPAGGPPPPSPTGRPRAVVEAPPIASGPAATVQAALAAVGQAAQQVGRTAVAVAHNGQFPLALVGVVAAFLFLQGRLDRRDPKLALARVREELSEFREFPEPPPTETT